MSEEGDQRVSSGPLVDSGFDDDAVKPSELYEDDTRRAGSKGRTPNSSLYGFGNKSGFGSSSVTSGGGPGSPGVVGGRALSFGEGVKSEDSNPLEERSNLEERSRTGGSSQTAASQTVATQAAPSQTAASAGVSAGVPKPKGKALETRSLSQGHPVANNNNNASTDMSGDDVDQSEISTFNTSSKGFGKLLGMLKTDRESQSVSSPPAPPQASNKVVKQKTLKKIFTSKKDRHFTKQASQQTSDKKTGMDANHTNATETHSGQASSGSPRVGLMSTGNTSQVTEQPDSGDGKSAPTGGVTNIQSAAKESSFLLRRNVSKKGFAGEVMRDELEDAQKRIEQQDRDIRKLFEEKKKLKDIETALRMENVRLENRVAELENTSASVPKADSQGVLKKIIADLKATRDELLIQKAQAAEEIELARRMNEDLMKEHSRVETDVLSMREELKAAVSERDRVNRTMKKVNYGLDLVNAEYALSMEKLEDANSQLTASREALSASNSALDELKRQKKTTAGKLAKSRADLEQKQRESSDTQRELESLKTDLCALKKELEESHKNLQRVRDSAGKIESDAARDHDELSASIEQLQRQLKASEAERAKANEVLSHVERKDSGGASAVRAGLPGELKQRCVFLEAELKRSAASSAAFRSQAEKERGELQAALRASEAALAEARGAGQRLGQESRAVQRDAPVTTTTARGRSGNNSFVSPPRGTILRESSVMDDEDDRSSVPSVEIRTTVNRAVSPDADRVMMMRSVVETEDAGVQAYVMNDRGVGNALINRGTSTKKIQDGDGSSLQDAAVPATKAKSNSALVVSVGLSVVSVCIAIAIAVIALVLQGRKVVNS